MQHKFSSYDMLGLVAELNERRIPMVYRGAALMLGGDVMLTSDEKRGVLLARVLHRRYQAGHYWHTDREAKEICELCLTLIFRYRTTHGHGSEPAIKWADSELTVQTHLPADAYEKVKQQLLR